MESFTVYISFQGSEILHAVWLVQRDINETALPIKVQNASVHLETDCVILKLADVRCVIQLIRLGFLYRYFNSG